jgi:hypothetical protein
MSSRQIRCDPQGRLVLRDSFAYPARRLSQGKPQVHMVVRVVRGQTGRRGKFRERLLFPAGGHEHDAKVIVQQAAAGIA